MIISEERVKEILTQAREEATKYGVSKMKCCDVVDLCESWLLNHATLKRIREYAEGRK